MGCYESHHWPHFAFANPLEPQSSDAFFLSARRSWETAWADVRPGELEGEPRRAAPRRSANEEDVGVCYGRRERERVSRKKKKKFDGEKKSGL